MGIIVMMNRILSLWLVAAGSQERLVAMKTLLTQWSLLLCGLLASSCLAAADIPEPNRQAPAESGISRATNRPLPWIFLVGDSTVHNSGKILGWGDVIGRYFNFDRIRVENCAKAGRSSRTFQTQGWWRQILDAARPGDFVFIQMGHNDAGPLDDTNRARGTIRGVDEETREIYNPVLQRPEIVHTYGWYLRKYVADARAKGMTPIVCSPVPRLPEQPVQQGAAEKNDYVAWSAEVAASQNAFFINLNQIATGYYAGMTPAQIRTNYFTPADTVHSSPAGAELNASAVIAGLRNLTNCPLNQYLLYAPAASRPYPIAPSPGD